MSDDTDAWVGERLRDARTSRGWSQEALSTRIGAGVRSVWRWENGAGRPRGQYAHLLDELFRATPPLLPADTAKHVRLQCRGCAELSQLVLNITGDLAETRARLEQLLPDEPEAKAS